MPATIATLAADPAPLTHRLTVAGAEITVRALDAGDSDALIAFLTGLSAPSRRFWHGDASPAAVAADWTGVIGGHDKLRLVAHPPGAPDRLAGLVDLSFCLPAGWEITRYAGYGRPLDPARTARFGVCVADARQGSGLAAALLPPSWSAVRLLGCDRVVLFGGVHEDNHRARRFYRRAGFTEAGRFTDAGVRCLDMDLTLP